MIRADELRRRGAARLAEAGVDSAGTDAALLLADVLGTEPGRLLLVDDVDEAHAARFDAAIGRRAAREPLQHITGTAHFAGLELAVGPGVFVPRPETELIVEWAAAHAAPAGAPGSAAGEDGDGPLRVADLCSGSGALALGIAAAVPTAQVIAVEKSSAALAYLRRNVAAAPAGERVGVVAGDVTDAAAMAPVLAGCRVIVSNPPYVPSASAVSPEVRHDPADAVFSGASGMDVIDAMIPIVAAALPAGGAFAVEHDDETADAVTAALSADGRFERIVAHRDLAGRPRFVTAFRSGGDVRTGADDDRARMER